VSKQYLIRVLKDQKDFYIEAFSIYGMVLNLATISKKIIPWYENNWLNLLSNPHETNFPP